MFFFIISISILFYLSIYQQICGYRNYPNGLLYIIKYNYKDHAGNIAGAYWTGAFLFLIYPEIKRIRWFLPIWNSVLELSGQNCCHRCANINLYFLHYHASASVSSLTDWDGAKDAFITSVVIEKYFYVL